MIKNETKIDNYFTNIIYNKLVLKKLLMLIAEDFLVSLGLIFIVAGMNRFSWTYVMILGIIDICILLAYVLVYCVAKKGRADISSNNNVYHYEFGTDSMKVVLTNNSSSGQNTYSYASLKKVKEKEKYFFIKTTGSKGFYVDKRNMTKEDIDSLRVLLLANVGKKTNEISTQGEDKVVPTEQNIENQEQNSSNENTNDKE